MSLESQYTGPLMPSTPSVDPSMHAVLIGGGNTYTQGDNWPKQDTLLDAGLDLTGLEHPNVLIVPSARWKSERGVNKVVDGYAQYYASRGLATEILHPFLYEPNAGDVRAALALEIDKSKVPSASELREKTEAADLVFVLGGDTNRMLNKVWKPLGIDDLLINAMKRGVIMSGTSAGTIAWFEGGHSDSETLQKNPDKPEQFHYIRGLGRITTTVVCPHYDSTHVNQPERSRKASFRQMMYNRRILGELGIGIDNDAAIRFSGGGAADVISGSGEGGRLVHALHYRQGVLNTQTVTPEDGQFSLADLTE